MFPWRTIILAIAAVLVAAPDALPSQPHGHKWWEAADVRAELGLTVDQSARIEEVFQSALPDLRRGKAELDRLEDELAELLARPRVDEADVVRQIDRVEAARSELAKGRALMLFRMHQVLSVGQREQLKALHERRRAESRRGTNPE